MQPSNDPGNESRPDLPPGSDSPPPSPAASSGRPGWLMAWAVAAALASGLLAWLAGEPALEAFRPTAAEVRSSEASYVGTDNTPYVRAMRRVAIRNAALHDAIFGLAVGLSLGLAGGLARRSVGGALVGGGLGLILGGVAAGLGSLALVPVFLNNHSFDQPSLLLPALIHGGIWSVTGAAGGLALAFGLGRSGRLGPAAVGGMIGAVLGTVLFEATYAGSFPFARTESAIPSEPMGRLLADLLVAAAIAAGAARASRAA